MNKYTQWLDLDFDPFAPSSTSRDFYCSGHRQQLLDQIVEFSLYSNAMIAVTGPLGAGKTTLATNFCERFAEETVCVKVAATMFMNQSQFIESLQTSLSFKPAASVDSELAIGQICQYAAELDLEARSLILIIDDAHELSAEVLQLVIKLLDSCVDSSIHALLFGESQLDNLLQNTLSAEAQERLAVFSLEGFGSDETHEYIQFKLATAGFANEMPIAGGVVGAIHNSSQGMPGAINGLVADALNLAALATAPIAQTEEVDDIVDFGLIGSSEGFSRTKDIEEFDGLHATERVEGSHGDDDESDDARRAGIASIQPQYWAAAAILLVLLTGTLLFWNASPRVAESLPIAVAVTPTLATTSSTQGDLSVDSAPMPALASLEEATSAVELSGTIVAATESLVVPESAVAVEEASVPEPVLVGQIESEPEPVEVVSSQPYQSTVGNAAQQIAAAPVAGATAVLTEGSPFEQLLLQESSDGFAIQLLASGSEVDISKFVGQLGDNHPAGYFETRHQGKPWFVAILASFSDREQASQAVSALPEKLRSNQPWIRSVVGIQADIREQLSSRLVSVK